MQILSGLCGKLFVFKAKLKNENQKMMGGMWVVNAKDAERREVFAKGVCPGRAVSNCSDP